MCAHTHTSIYINNHVYVCVNTNVAPLTSIGNVSMVTCGKVASNTLPRHLVTY